ncbi:hypothetical protein [Mucilaginibacter celer]|uniref:Uncharacterized protein n=1 Tax=Mucilaginibacter celer TaxID=2305508 RepID=A0A494VT19_9SPHI|nr:hypothetical protein [Mucilaginibacter celer]AYL94493.1 hypothetical protein HYN43_003895 [Mucilaginibacter celer]
MHLSRKIQKAIADHQQILAALKLKGKENNWVNFTRTQFNLVARVINKQISKEVIANPDLVEMGLIIGRQQLNNHLETLRCHNVYDFIKYLGNMGEYRVFNWISGKTLQSYWNGGEAKYVKANALLVFLQVPFNQWDEWQKETGKSTGPYRHSLAKAPVIGMGQGKSSMAVIKSYFLGNYFLYYQKTDGSKNVIKTPFVLKESDSGQVIVQSVSEGHRYSGKVIGIRDGCLYINCQNLDFEEMEQYVFNLGLETKPEVLFGVSNTVSVKNRQAVALKNILVKQKSNDPAFESIPEAEIPFSRYYDTDSEEAIIVNYLKQSPNNIITTATCCNLDDIAGLARESA